MAVGALNQIILSHFFGGGADIDAYFLAISIPQYLQAVAFSTVATVFVPALAKLLDQNDQAGAVALRRGIILVTIVAGSIVATFLVAFRPLLASTWTLIAGQTGHAAALRFGHIVWPSLVGYGVSIIGIAFLQATGRYGRAVMVPLLGGIIQAAIVVFFHDALGIAAAAISFLANAAVQTMMTFAFFIESRRPAQLVSTVNLGAAGAVYWSALPIILASFLIRITPILDRTLAAQFAAGTVAHVTYAFALIGIVGTFFTSVTSTILLPRLSFDFASGGVERMGSTVVRSLELLASLIVPAATLGFLFGPHAVAIMLQHGEFGARDARAVALAFQLYMPALVFMSVGSITGRSLYALGVTRLVAVAGVIEAVIYILVTFWLVETIGWTGIPIGFGIYYAFSFLWGLLYVAWRTDTPGFRIARALMVPAVASAIAFGAARGAIGLFGGNLALSLLAAFLFGAVYAAVMLLLKSNAPQGWLSLLRR